MLILILYVGESAFGIDCQYVVEVLPCVAFEKNSRLPEFIPGVVNFYGKPVSVIDFCRLISDGCCPAFYHTRIAILQKTKEDGSVLNVGVMGERMVEVIKIDISQADDISAFYKSPHLERTLEAGGRTIQLINPEELFQTVHGAV